MQKLLIGLGCWLLAQTVSAQTLTQRLEELMNGFRQTNQFNGNVLVARHDSILLQASFGLENVAAQKPLKAESRFQIGSVTKQFTTTLVLRLAEKGQLRTSDKLSKYLSLQLFPAGDSITIAQLMAHTAGVFNYTNDEKFMQSGVTQPLPHEALIKRFAGKPLEFIPGSQWAYSNSGYVLLGAVLEKVTGKPYETLVYENVFRPLQMTASGFDFTHLSGNKASGYLSKAGDQAVPAPIVDSSISYAAGAIYSTTGDLYRWADAVLHQQILSAGSWTQAFTPILNNYGFGWMIGSEQPLFVWHSGGIHGFNSNIYLEPADKVAIILLSNVNTPLLDSINRTIVKVLRNQPYVVPAAKKEIALDSNTLKTYTGKFELQPGVVFDIQLHNGKQLKAKLGAQPAFDIYPSGQDHFFYKVVAAELEYKRDDAGNITHLVLHQNGRSIPCKKLN